MTTEAPDSAVDRPVDGAVHALGVPKPSTFLRSYEQNAPGDINTRSGAVSRAESRRCVAVSRSIHEITGTTTTTSTKYFSEQVQQ